MPALAIDQASTALSQHAAAIVLAHLLLGAVTLMMLESWAPSDALYFCVTTLTTVGYGDLAPKTQSGRLFTSLHVLMGCSLVASCLGTLVGRMQAGLMEREGGAKSSAQSREINELVKALGVAGAIVIVGVAYASFVEGWGLVDAIYWAAVSCTSVGLGDLAPSPVMRPIAGIYLLLAVGGFAAAIGRVARFAAAFELGRRRDAFVERGVTTEILEQIDTDGNVRLPHLDPSMRLVRPTEGSRIDVSRCAGRGEPRAVCQIHARRERHGRGGRDREARFSLRRARCRRLGQPRRC